MTDRVHLDTDFLIYALSARGPERRKLRELAESDAVLEISSIAWYEFCRGPRTVEQLAVARALFGDDGIIAFDERLAERAADEFRRLARPRKHAADVAIGVVARELKATLVTRNGRDFAGIDGLRLDVAGD